MTIKEIEARTGLPRASVRYYETEKLISPARGTNGYRDYSEENCTLLLKIKLLRQLGCSLEDIKALQSGERPLAEVLDERLRQLEAERGELDQAQALCEKLRADGVSWERLEPARYLDWTAEPARPEVPDVGKKIPWRRYFARSLDATLYGASWYFVLGLVFRINILQRSGAEKIFDNVVGLVLMLALEPLFLHKFGTTPGKWVLGLHLTRSDGSYFSYQEGITRTVNVIAMGLGFSIPLVSSITLLLGYLRCRWDREQPWALEDEVWSDFAVNAPDFWSAKGCGKRIAGYLGTNAAVVAISVIVFYAASLPWHHGALTPERFADNYNHVLTFSEAPESPGRLMGADGKWYQADPNSYVVDLGGGPIDLDIETENGIVTAVSFSVNETGTNDDFAFRSVPVESTILPICALTGRNTIYLPFTHWGQMLQEIQEMDTGTYTWSVDGWVITCSLETEGYYFGQGHYLVAYQDQEQSLTYQFRMGQG